MLDLQVYTAYHNGKGYCECPKQDVLAGCWAVRRGSMALVICSQVVARVWVGLVLPIIPIIPPIIPALPIIAFNRRSLVATRIDLDRIWSVRYSNSRVYLFRSIGRR